MRIEGVGRLDAIQPIKNNGRNDLVREGKKSDSISLSSEAREKAEVYQVMELIKSAPELDDVQIAELRAKINDPAYLSDRILGATAESIMRAFGIVG